MATRDFPTNLRAVAAQLLEIATDERDIDSASLIGLASDLLVGAGDLEAFLRTFQTRDRITGL